MKLANQIDELINAGIISEDIAEKIRDYYREKGSNQQHSYRLILAFAILGATLIGLGILLIIAHNWDSLSRSIKTVFAFLPLLIGHAMGLFVLLRKRESSAWREGVSIFIFFSVAASISLVSQIYNIPGDMADFLLTWMLLSLPLFYLMQSSITSLLYLVGITAYAVAEGYFNSGFNPVWSFWALWVALLPYYFYLLKRNPAGNFVSFFNWLLPASLLICLGLFSNNREELMVPVYLLMLGVFYLVGKTSFFDSQKTVNNGYQVIGLLGSLGMLLFLTFDEFWHEWMKLKIADIFFVSEFWLIAFFTATAVALLFRQKLRFSPLHWLIVFLYLIFLSGFLNVYLALLLINFFYLFTGIWYIREGSQNDHLGILNFGLIIIASLVVARFFDANLSFVIRGLIFLFVGAGFFLANYRLLKKRNEQIN